MNPQDDAEKNLAAHAPSDDGLRADALPASEATTTTDLLTSEPRRHVDLSVFRHQVRIFSARLSERVASLVPATRVRPEGSSELRWHIRWRRRHQVQERQDPFQGWQEWSKFRLWRHTRPFWGSVFMLLGACIMLGDAVFFLSLAFLAQSLGPAILVGGLLLVMGLIPLFLPTHAVITGAIGVVLSLVSLLVASFGGCGIGLLLGLIGSTLCIAWRPVERYKLVASTISTPATNSATQMESPD